MISIFVKILIVIIGIVIVIFLLVFLTTFFGGMFSIGYVIKKSTEKKSQTFLNTEKLEMLNNVKALKINLKNWENYTINSITNNLEYSYLRWITSKLSGTIKASDGNKVIAFERRQRGNYIDCRICASSSEFDSFIEYKNDITTIELNGKYMGKIDFESTIYDASNQKIASLDRYSDDTKFFIRFENGFSVVINRSFDNKVFINNPSIGTWHSLKARNRQKIAREQYQSYAMIEQDDTFDAFTKNWIIALVLKETIYNSFSFVS
jgi:hypothetical protein